MKGAVTILDGGMGKELRRIGAPFRQPEWSSLALMEAPDKVVEAHRNFLDAGARVVTTNNYAVVPYHHDDAFIDERGDELTSLAGSLARRAVEDSGFAGARVAGSIPPLFGSYEPDRFDASLAAPLYRRIVSSLDPFAHLWLAETLSTTDEIAAILDAIERTGGADRPVWISVTVPDESEADGVVRLVSGHSMADVVEAVSGRGVEALLVNCSTPERTGPSIAQLRSAVESAGLDVELGGYANAFPEERHGEYSAKEVIFERRDDLTADVYADTVARWIDESGATIVGGCCDMYPEHIAELARRFG